MINNKTLHKIYNMDMSEYNGFCNNEYYRVYPTADMVSNDIKNLIKSGECFDYYHVGFICPQGDDLNSFGFIIFIHYIDNVDINKDRFIFTNIGGPKLINIDEFIFIYYKEMDKLNQLSDSELLDSRINPSRYINKIK